VKARALSVLTRCHDRGGFVFVLSQSSDQFLDLEKKIAKIIQQML
jgi:hypothetical protein